jgi:hypothetical protein
MSFFDRFSNEDRLLIQTKCDYILEKLIEKVNKFDDSQDAIYDFIEFINNITEDKVIHGVFYGCCPKWVVQSLCNVLRNRKLFMIYWSRHLGWNLGSIGCIYFDMLCRELIKLNELDNVRHLLHTRTMVDMIHYYYIEPGFEYSMEVLNEKMPQLMPYINEIRSKIINQNYKGEDEYMWADESKEWFGNKLNTFTSHRQYYNFSRIRDII